MISITHQRDSAHTTAKLHQSAVKENESYVPGACCREAEDFIAEHRNQSVDKPSRRSNSHEARGGS